MRLTQKLKDFAVSSGWATATATDDAIEKAVGAKMTSGELSAEKFGELTKEKGKSAKALIDGIVKQAVEAALAGQKTASAPTLAPVGSPNPNKAFFGAAGDFVDKDIVVKPVADRYDDSRKSLVYPTHTKGGRPHALAGLRVKRGYLNEPMDDLSDRDRAIAGAWFKMSLWKNSPPDPQNARFKPNEEDLQLIQYALEHKKWSGPMGPHFEDDSDKSWDDGRYTYENEPLHKQHQVWLKTLLDDSTSGGINITPQVFDDAVILYPVLYGELYPFVNVVPVTRGRRVIGGIMNNPTVSWGTAEGTAITPFSTTNFITSFNNNIFPAVGACQLGLDFLEDSPINVSQTLIDRWSLVMMQQLDNVIALGDGTTQPTGIFTATGTTTILTDNGVPGPPTVSDFEQMLFGVPKQYRQEPGAKPVYISNETTYARGRGIQVDSTDQRRVFGLNETDYMMMGNPHKINASIANYQAAFAMLNRYRMYRRLGLIVRIETLGQTLALSNTKLIVIRARYGGAPELGAAFSVSSSFQG